MRIEKSTFIGWPWLGLGKIVVNLSEFQSKKWYTMLMVFITNKFAFGIHLGGGKKLETEKSDKETRYISQVNNLLEGYDIIDTWHTVGEDEDNVIIMTVYDGEDVDKILGMLNG